MSSLNGVRVLLVEDEGLVALMIEDMLRDFGCEIAASVAGLKTAMDKASALEVDVAMLDVNLAGQPSFPVAEILRQRSVPVLFCTGYGSTSLPSEFGGSPVLNKPFSQWDLEQKLTQLLGR